MKNHKYLIDPNTKERIRVRPIPTPTPTNGQWLYNGERLYYKDGRPPPLPLSSSGGTVSSHGVLEEVFFIIFLMIISFLFGFITAYINF